MGGGGVGWGREGGEGGDLWWCGDSGMNVLTNRYGRISRQRDMKWV